MNYVHYHINILVQVVSERQHNISINNEICSRGKDGDNYHYYADDTQLYVECVDDDDASAEAIYEQCPRNHTYDHSEKLTFSQFLFIVQLNLYKCTIYISCIIPLSSALEHC